MAVRITILVNKIDTISYEQFHEYWSKSHPKVFLSVPIVREKVIKYSQFHVDNQTSEHLKGLGIPIASYDGGVNMWGASVEDLMQVFQDPEYNKVVVPDEESFLKRSEAIMMIGSDEDKWVDHKPTPGVEL